MKKRLFALLCTMFIFGTVLTSVALAAGDSGIMPMYEPDCPYCGGRSYTRDVGVTNARPTALRSQTCPIEPRYICDRVVCHHEVETICSKCGRTLDVEIVDVTEWRHLDEHAKSDCIHGDKRLP